MAGAMEDGDTADEVHGFEVGLGDPQVIQSNPAVQLEILCGDVIYDSTNTGQANPRVL